MNEDEEDYDYEEDDYDMVPFEEENYYRNQQETRKEYQTRRMVGETIGGVLNAVTEYPKTLEHEKTNRKNVERKRKTALTVIRSERQVMLEYLKSRFGERSELYNKWFQLIETAMQLKNEEILRIALESIQSIYQDSPGNGIDEFKQQFDSMSEVIRI
jgi:hypothetical protein